MPVPNQSSFSLQDVIDEINPSSPSLSQCFAEANASGFDPAYEGAKDRLSNFRNYSHFSGQLAVNQDQIRGAYVDVSLNWFDSNNNPIQGAQFNTNNSGATTKTGPNFFLLTYLQTFKLRIEVEMNAAAPSNYAIQNVIIPIGYVATSGITDRYEWASAISTLGFVDGTVYGHVSPSFSINSKQKRYITINFRAKTANTGNNNTISIDTNAYSYTI